MVNVYAARVEIVGKSGALFAFLRWLIFQERVNRFLDPPERLPFLQEKVIKQATLVVGSGQDGRRQECSTTRTQAGTVERAILEKLFTVR